MRALSAGLLLFLGACAIEDAAPVPGDEPGVERSEAQRTGFRNCSARFTASPPAGWRHYTSRLVSGLGSAVHAASDTVALPGATASLQAHFGYGGALDKDLEDEWVWVFVYDCTAWRYVGYAKTDDDGRATFVYNGALPAGAYDARMEVVGDATSVPLRLWVIPAGTHLAVFDVDGTLTTDDGELFEEILLGWVPEAYHGAADVTRAEDARREQILYVTGRPEILAGHTRAWLQVQGFAPGIVKLARTVGDVVPTNSGVGAYKTAYLKSLKAAGMFLDDAFGNATTDIYAYAQAGIRLDRTWIIGDNAGTGGTIPVTGQWDAVAARLYAEPPVPQP